MTPKQPVTDPVSAAPDAERVADRTRRGLSWNLVGAISTNATRLIVVAVLGRALSSDAFGVVAAAISINVLFYSVRDLGVGQAVVQQKTVDAGHLGVSFAISTYLGVAFSLMLLFAAPLIADLYRIQDAENVIRAIGLLFVLRGVGNTSRMMCQRAMNFRVIALVDTGAFMVGSATSVVLALLGAGPWSLIAGYLTEEALGTTAFLYYSPPPFTLRVDRSKLRDLMRFGTAQTISQIAATLATYGDNFVVGHALGARMLGYYTRAYDLIRFPSAVFDNIVGNVLFPAFSRFQDHSDKLAVSFRRALFANATILLPASAALFVVAPEAIRLLMGANWDSAVVPFRILILTMMMRTSAKLGQMISSAAGGIRGVAIVNCLYMVFVIVGAMISIQWGIPGVATSTALAIAFAFMAFSYLGSRISALSARQLIGAHIPGLVIAAAVGVVSWVIADQLRSRAAPSPVVFASVAIGSILLTLAITGVLIKSAWGDFGWLKTELASVRARVKRSRLAE